MRTIPAEKFWLDHILAVAAGMMGVYSVGMSVTGSDLANVMTLWVLLAGIAGYGLSMLVEGTKIERADGWLLAMFAMGGISQTRTINNMLPEEGFPFAILAATMMFILLIAGGLFAWRDATLLFVSLPSLVLFGLVGTIDSWKPSLFLFCAMLLCLAVLYARVHQRTMIRWAEEGGSDRRLLHRDVWRWVAGPEYALVAAGTIILLSFLGAPVVQGSLTGVSEAVRVNVGATVRNSFNRAPSQIRESADSPVGTGPVNLSDRVVAIVEIDRPRYLRREVYERYVRGGWSRQRFNFQNVGYGFASPGQQLKLRRTSPFPAIAEVERGEEVRMKIKQPSLPGATLPIPGPVVEIDREQPDPTEGVNGEFIIRSPVESAELGLVVRVPLEEQITTRASAQTMDVTQTVKNSYTVLPNQMSFPEMREVQLMSGTDYDKLWRLKTIISKRCVYNTQTPRSPRDRDPVEHFLNDSREGYCDLFASSFAVLARQLGYPSRYVTGYLMEPAQRQSNGTYLIREKHSHAWAEVYFEGYGWIPFDATEGARNVSPALGEERRGPSPWEQFQKLWEKSGTSIMAALGALLLGGVLWFAYRGRGESSNSDPQRPLRVLVGRFQLALEAATGHPRRFSQTLREFTVMHRELLIPLHTKIDQILPILEGAMYSSQRPEPEELKRISAIVAELTREAKELKAARKKAARSA